MTLIERVRDLQRTGRLDLAPIGAGATAERWQALAELARVDVSEARIAESHVDAVQILGEIGRSPHPGCLYGVWASEHARWTTVANAAADGSVTLAGAKAFCTGADLLDRALVTVRHGDAAASGDGTDASVLLVDVDLQALGSDRIDTSMWDTPALADTATAVVDLTDVEIAASDVVGAPGWYLDRPGFWDGAVGPAACWAGAALGLVDHAHAHPPDDPHGRAHLGALTALAWSLETTLAQAGREVDARWSADDADAARERALTVRHLVDVACAEVQERFARALGPRPLVSDRSVIARDQALSLYRRQSHAERDLETLGRLAHRRRTSPDPPG